MSNVISQIGPEKAMETVARWFSGADKLKIHWTKTTDVCADIKTKTLFIPIACCSSSLTQEALMLLRAKIYHESAHILETQECKFTGAKFKILNALEDIRIEHKTASKGEGISFAYRFQNEKFNIEWSSKVTAGGVPPFMEALAYMMFVADNIVPAWTLTPKAKELVDLANPIFVKVHDTKSSKDCEKLAEQIYNLWKDKIEQDKNPQKKEKKDPNQENDQQDPNQESESDSGGGEGDGEGESGDEDDGDGSGSGKEPEEKEDDGESKQKSAPAKKESKEPKESKGSSEKGKEKKEDSGKVDGEGEGEEGKESKKKGGKAKVGQNSENNPTESAEAKTIPGEEKEQVSAEAELEKAMKGELKKAFQDVTKELENAMKDPGFYTADRTIDKHIQFDSSSSDTSYYNDAHNQIGNEISALVKSAEQAFYFRKRTKTQRHIKHGEIDFTKLVPIAKGLSREVYMRKTEGDDLNTSVSIVIDQSGSMGGRVQPVKLLLIALGEMLHKIGVPFEIFGTTTFDSPQANNAFTRYRAIKYIHYKNFNENWMIVHPKIMRLTADNNNIDGEAVEYAASSLATRKEARKIVFSICDGIPESGQYNDDVFRFQLKATCDKVRKSGVEVYAIGIDTTEPGKYYGRKNFIEVDSGKLLSPETIRVFTDTIMQGKFSVPH